MNIISVSIIKTPLTPYKIIIVPDSMSQTRDDPSIATIDTILTPEHTDMALVNIVPMIKVITRTVPVTILHVMVQEAPCHVCKYLCYTIIQLPVQHLSTDSTELHVMTPYSHHILGGHHTHHQTHSYPPLHHTVSHHCSSSHHHDILVRIFIPS